MDEQQTTNSPEINPEKKGGKGMLGIIAIIIILVLGGALLLSNKVEEKQDRSDEIGQTTNEDAFAVPEITNTSDDTTSIEEDLSEMDFSNIDQGL